MKPDYDVLAIARVCHEANRAYCTSIGDHSQVSWEEAPQWQKDSAVKGVELHLSGEASPEQSHQSWIKEKETTGWKYGATKDPEKKEHPCMVPYSELPLEQKRKDILFGSIVKAFKE